MRSIQMLASMMIIVFVISGITFAGSTGVDFAWYSNGWYTGESISADGVLYQAITRDGTRDQTFAAARADGGVDIHNWGGVWATDWQVGAPVVYTSLDAWANKQYDYLATRADGGFDEIYYGASWLTWNIPINGVPTPAVYNAVATDDVAGGPGSSWEFFAARAGGGVDMFIASGPGWTLYNNIGTSEYVAMTSDINENRKYYAAKLNGGIDLVTETTVGELAGTTGLQYVSLAADKTVDDRLYGVKPDGSIEIIYLSGGTWLTQAVPVTEAFYIAMDTRDAIDISDSLYAVKRPLECGDIGTLMSGDMFQDCYVNSVDFTEFAAQWTQCSDPTDPNCP